MRTWRMSLLTAVVAALCVPTSAAAAFQHVVAPGESLSSVAAADGLSVSQLAAANGLSSDSELIAGSSLAIPPQDSAGVAGPVSDQATPATAPSAPQTVTTGGGYVVQPGDTLSAIAARYGVSMSALAADNGLDPLGVLLSGTTLNVSGLGGVGTGHGIRSGSGRGADRGDGQPGGGRIDRRRQRSVALAGRGDRLSGERLQQRRGLQHRRHRGDADRARHVELHRPEPGHAAAALAELSDGQHPRRGRCCCDRCWTRPAGTQRRRRPGTTRAWQSVQAHGLYTDTQQYVNDVMALSQRFGGQ